MRQYLHKLKNRPFAIKRGKFVAGAVLGSVLAGGFIATTTGATLTPIKISVGFAHQAGFAHFYLAKKNGYFADRGIDASLITTGTDVSGALQAGTVQFGSGNSGETLLTLARTNPTIDIVSLGAAVRAETIGLMGATVGSRDALPPIADVLADLNNPLEQRSVLKNALKGKIIGYTGFLANRKRVENILLTHNAGNDYVFRCTTILLTPALVNQPNCVVDYDPNKINLMVVGAGTPQLLANAQATNGATDGVNVLNTNAIDVIADAPIWRVPALYNDALGLDPARTDTYTRLEFKDLGAPPSYIETVGALKSYVAANPKTAGDVMKAWQKGLIRAIAFPEEAIDAFVALNPLPRPAGMTDDQYAAATAHYRAVSAVQWYAVRALTQDADSDAHGIGWQNQAVFDGQQQFFVDSGILAAKVCTPPLTQCMTNAYLPVE